jgi:hypothetical protein
MLRSPSTSGQAKRSCFIRPVSGKAPGSSAAGATGPKSKVSAGPSGPATCAKPMPPKPEFQGSTAARAKAVATAASAALPPASSMETPASAAAPTCDTTIPARPRAAGCRTCQVCVRCGAAVALGGMEVVLR